MNAAIITARVGSPESPDKNMYPVNGIPLISYPIRIAREAKLIDEIFVSTDGPEIAAYCHANGVKVIERPQELRGLDVNHGDVIRHAVEHVNATSIALENVAVLLGNSVMLDGATLDKAFSILDSQPDVDSCMTVWKAVNDHPERAMGLVDGALTAYQGGNTHVTTEHEAYPAAYYFDQGAWIFRKETVSENSGPGPWWWMGKKCVPIVRPWIQGRDVHRYFDLLLAEWWVQNEEKIARINSAEKS